jgi:glucose/arabinose dehydrogenase
MASVLLLLQGAFLAHDPAVPETLPTAEAQASTGPITVNNNSTAANFTAKVATPVLHDPDLEIQLVTSGIEFGTQMDFIGNNDMLVLQKNDGKVLRVTDCNIQTQPVLDLTVANLVERGLLGLAVYNNTSEGKTYAFIYFTNARGQDGDDALTGSSPEGNRLYRYELVEGLLQNEKPLAYLSAQRGASHNGGVVLLGPDNNIYFAVGDIASHKTRAQNYHNGSAADGTSSIMRIDPEGRSPGAILGRDEPLSKYYAYGIRNSYGLDFDPVTNNLWDTENGPDHSDEVNLVEPGFNSGWRAIMGFPNATGLDEQELVACLYCSSITGLFDRWVNENVLGIIEGRYSDPEFVWKIPIGVTAIKFLDSNKLGAEYENDVFVADYILGNIHRFELNENRDGFVLGGVLADKTADTWEELESVTFAQGLRTITDLEVGPDGYLYVLAYTPSGNIYRIVPSGTPEPCS